MEYYSVWRLCLSLTCQVFLAHFKSVHEGCDDTLDCAKHAAQPQVHQHEEEHDWPKRRGREVGHGLSEGNEGESCALHSLREMETEAV